MFLGNTDLSEDMSDVDELSDLEDDVDMESTGSAEDNDEDFDINDEDKGLYIQFVHKFPF